MATLQVGVVILLEAALSFLGIGRATPDSGMGVAGGRRPATGRQRMVDLVLSRCGHPARRVVGQSPGRLASRQARPRAERGSRVVTAPGEPLLEVSDLRTHLDTKNGLVRAVDGVSFRLHAEETLGIIGESGSGKSMTALSILQVVPKPAARIVGGRVLYRGQNLLEKNEREMRRIRGREIAMILQDPQTSLNPVFTVGNQIVEALRIHRRNDRRKALLQRAVEALKQVRNRRSRGAHPFLPASDERRHEAACRWCDGDFMQAPHHCRRRAHDVARRDDSGTVSAAASRSAARNRTRHTVHHA